MDMALNHESSRKFRVQHRSVIRSISNVLYVLSDVTCAYFNKRDHRRMGTNVGYAGTYRTLGTRAQRALGFAKSDVGILVQCNLRNYLTKIKNIT